MREMNILVSSPLRDPVFSSYALSVCTGHTLGSPEREGKKNSVMGFPWRDCLAREWGRNATPSGLNCLLVGKSIVANFSKLISGTSDL